MCGRPLDKNVPHQFPPSRTPFNDDSAWQSPKEKSLMENTQDDLKAHLMQTNEEFRRLASQHSEYHKQLEAIEAKSHLTAEDEVEEHRLKKLKLRLKDEMTALLSRYRMEQVH
jgi:uncharacterized protein YdcH (DUF465 family)